MADNKVTLEIEFDDREAQSGIERIARDLRQAGSGSGGGASGGGGGRPTSGSEDADDEGGGKAGRTLRAMLVGNLISPISESIQQGLNPLRTAFEKQEFMIRAGAQAAGTIGGAFAGNALRPILGESAVEVGSVVGGQAAAVASEAFFQQEDVARERFVNERVNSALQNEAQTRGVMGVEFTQQQAAEMGQSLAAQFRLMFDNMLAAVEGTNQAVGGLDIASAVAGIRRDVDVDLARNDMLSTGRDEGQ